MNGDNKVQDEAADDVLSRELKVQGWVCRMRIGVDDGGTERN